MLLRYKSFTRVRADHKAQDSPSSTLRHEFFHSDLATKNVPVLSLIQALIAVHWFCSKNEAPMISMMNNHEIWKQFIIPHLFIPSPPQAPKQHRHTSSSSRIYVLQKLEKLSKWFYLMTKLENFLTQFNVVPAWNTERARRQTMHVVSTSVSQ